MGPNMLIMPGSYRDQGAFARLFCDLPSYLALVNPCYGARRPERPDFWLMPGRGQEFASLHLQSVGLFAVASPHCDGVSRGSIHRTLGSKSCKCAVRLPLLQKALTTT